MRWCVTYSFTTQRMNWTEDKTKVKYSVQEDHRVDIRSQGFHTHVMEPGVESEVKEQKNPKLCRCWAKIPHHRRIKKYRFIDSASEKDHFSCSYWFQIIQLLPCQQHYWCRTAPPCGCPESVHFKRTIQKKHKHKLSTPTAWWLRS